MTGKGHADRRIRKTREQLHGALASLLHEKPYDDIVVKEILARADVGRSTFYAHFRDKDELLDSGLRDVLHVGDGASASPIATIDTVLAFSAPFFAHVERVRAETTVDSGRLAVVHERLERLLVERIAAELQRARARCANGGARRLPTDLVARQVASTFLLVLDWWCARDDPAPAAMAEELFRALVVPMLTEAIG